MAGLARLISQNRMFCAPELRIGILEPGWSGGVAERSGTEVGSSDLQGPRTRCMDANYHSAGGAHGASSVTGQQLMSAADGCVREA